VHDAFVRKVHMPENIDNTVLLDTLQDIRRELRDHRTLLLESIAQGRSLEMHVDTQLLVLGQRVKELKDDVELLIKSELLGVLGGEGPRG
jgi:hypothetical protein